MSVKNKYMHLEFPDLPRLPVPHLQETMNKYLQCVTPLLSQEELEVEKRLVGDFLKIEGPRLHEELVRLSKETPTSYLEGFWDLAYQGMRSPLCININPSFSMGDCIKKRNGIERAASVIQSALNFQDKIITNTLKQDSERRIPLCMSQYGKLFGSTRVPKPVRDEYHEFKDVKHIAVFCRNLVYSIPIYDPNGVRFREGHFITMLDKIYKNAAEINFHDGLHPGIFTSDEREVWAKARQELIEGSPVNAETIKIIESSLFSVCLEHNVLQSDTEQMQCLIHGTGLNRWFDKNLQFIVDPRGKTGLNMEHSGFDGHTVIIMFHNMFADELKREIPKALEVEDYMAEPLKWVISQNMGERMKMSFEKMKQFVQRTQLHTLRFDKYGAKEIKGMKCSPDAFVQMAYQLTYYKMMGKPGNTYESANTKRFYHGRTECIRSCTNEALKFAQTWCNEESGPEEKEEALRHATSRHVQMVIEAKKGLGVDRHIWVMYCLAKHKRERLPNYRIPGLYSGPGMSKLWVDLMSTSNCSGTPSLRWFGFGPTSSDCFGVGYVVENEEIHACVSSFKNRAREFAEVLEQSLLEMRDILVRKKE